MNPMRFFIDTHDRTKQTFPPELSAEQFEAFFDRYAGACAVEGVVPLRVHVGLEAGRAFCFNMAPDADAVRRAHERAGLPYDSITEVQMVTPGDLYFQPR